MPRHQRHDPLDVSHAGARRRRKIQGRFCANSIEGLLQACIGGAGIANLSAWFVRDEIADGRVIAIELADAVPDPLDVWAVYPSSRLVPAKVRLFIDALGTHLKTAA